MKNLGYSPAEQKLVLSRLMVLNYAPDCPYIASASSFVSIESAADDHNQLQTAFKEFFADDRTRLWALPAAFKRRKRFYVRQD